MPSPTTEHYPQLISLAVHEFRTPAGVVSGYLRMLQRDDSHPLSDRQRKMIDEAEKSCARLLTLISELSDVGKIDAGLVALTPKPIDLSALLTNVAELVHEGKERDVQLVLRGHPDGLPMNGDSARLHSAFEAIFRAILREKAGPATVVAEWKRETVGSGPAGVIVVADEPDVQEAYTRDRVPFNEKRGGMGLALPLARRVFEGHGGRIWSPGGDDPISRGSAIVVLPLTE